MPEGLDATPFKAPNAFVQASTVWVFHDAGSLTGFADDDGWMLTATALGVGLTLRAWYRSWPLRMSRASLRTLDAMKAECRRP